MLINCGDVYEKILVYERILYELDKINKIESDKFFLHKYLLK